MASRCLRRLAFLLAATVLLQLVTPMGQASAGSRCPGADSRPGESTHARLGVTTVCLVNRARQRRGLRRLRMDRRLSLAALRHAADMVRRSYFTHDSFSGARFSARLFRAGYMRGTVGWRVGENLAWGGGRSSTPRSVVRRWLNSPSHRANVLDRGFRDIGVGVSPGVPVPERYSAEATYVHEFGFRR